VKSVFGFRVGLGNPDLDFENLNPDFPIQRTLRKDATKPSQRGVLLGNEFDKTIEK